MADPTILVAVAKAVVNVAKKNCFLLAKKKVKITKRRKRDSLYKAPK